jgi:putative copper resistance protein D
MIDRQLQQMRFLALLIACSMPLIVDLVPLYAQHGGQAQVGHYEAAVVDHDHHAGEAVSDGWEGSAAGIAYSERNHHIAGWCVLLMGLAELSHAMRISSFGWARLLLPAAMLFSGVFVVIWSDHEAWPIGSLSLTETLFGHDHEIVQHKFFGLLALVVGSVELFRRLGHLGHMGWAIPLPLMAIVGGLMLFGHSHGVHPSAQKIALHHTVMGAMAITAGSSKLVSGWRRSESRTAPFRWELLWAGLILFIGAQLLIYSE